MTIDDLLRVNGARNATGAPPLSQLRGSEGPWVHRWFNVGLEALTFARDGQEVVGLVAFSDKEYKTDRGIGIGSSREAIESAYGTPTAVTGQARGAWVGIYEALGVAFDVLTGSPWRSSVTVISISPLPML